MRIKNRTLTRLLIWPLLITLTGCGSQKKDSEGYYALGWTSDQKIITSYRHNQIQGSDNSEAVFANQWISEIDPKDLTEEKIANIPWDDGPGYFFGKKGEFVGYIGVSRLSRSYVIKKIIFPDQAEEASVATESSFASLFLNPAKTLMVINEENRFRIYGTELNFIKERELGINAVWKNDTELFFYDQSSDKLALYNMTTESVSLFAFSFKPEFFSPTQNLLSSVENGILYQYNLSTETITSRNLSYDYQKLGVHYFSPDGKKLLLSSWGGFYISPPDIELQSALAIYLYDLETDVLTKVRD